jgi:hypothetical protein
MKFIQIRLSCVFALTVMSAIAGEAQSQVPLLQEPEEIQAALEAAPPHLREGAGVYVLEKSGYRRARASRNGFNCLVERRQYAGSFSPECFDAEGSKAFLPVILYRTEQSAKGVSPAEVERAVAARYQRHEFIPPGHVGICYMLSERNMVVLDRATGKIGHVGPHLMFYAPNASGADFGATPDMAAHFIIADEGMPGAMIVVPVATSGDAHEHH